MRVLLTGATGFVGARVTRALLARGDEVIAVARTTTHQARLGEWAGRVQLHPVDLGDSAVVQALIHATKPEACLHLAWYAEHGKYWTSPLNFDCVAQTVQLAQALLTAGCRRFVGAGTCAEYDWNESEHDERTTPCRPHTLYGAAKLGTYLMLDRFLAGSPMSFAWARYNFLYGPGEASARLVPSVMAKLAAGESVPLTAGDQVRDFIHVDDGAAATVALLHSAVTGAVNIGAGTLVPVRAVAREIAKHYNGAGRLQFGAVTPKAPEPARLAPKLDRLTREVGWRPAFTLETGIAQAVQAFNAARAQAPQ